MDGLIVHPESGGAFPSSQKRIEDLINQGIIEYVPDSKETAIRLTDKGRLYIQLKQRADMAFGSEN